ncbi:MAG TPA: ComEC/Rec2 family competence protein, partial [Ktedonobacterales bacterium]|nr:ComEC/Rec2 family competence protein [Ktedonobacterales bacterium]
MAVSGMGATLKPVRPLFGGYVLVAFACAWLVGDWLAGQGPMEGLTPAVWLAVGAVGLALAIGGALGARRYGLSRRWRQALRVALAAGALLLWLGLGAARAAAADPLRDPLSIGRYADGATVQAQGQVITEPDERGGYRFLTVRVTSIAPSGEQAQPAAGDVEATVYGPDDWFAPAYGDTVTLTGALQPLDGAYAPAGVVARMPSARARILARGGGSPLLAAFYQWRVALAQAIERSLPEPEAALLIGILLGLKSPALRARLPLFVATGTIHLVVPAGLKVSVLAELASRAARRLGAWPQTLAALAAVGAYAAIGGGGPAAVRAAIMGTLLALAPALGRSYNVYTALALAALIMTGIEPALIADAGFQLTLLATFALPLLTPGIQAALRRLAGPLGKPQIAEPITESLAVTLAAEVATIPVVALTFHTASLVAPLANLLTVPLLAPLLLLGGALAAVAALGWAPVALGMAWIVWPPLAWVNDIIAWAARLPLAALNVEQAPVALAPLYYLALAGAIVALWPWLRAAGAVSGMARHGRASLGRRGALIALGLSLLASLGASAPALASSARAHLDFLDVGPGGAAILLREPGGFTALIDGGPNGPALESALAARLPFWSRSLDLVVLTDARAGEARGLDDAAAHYHITSAVDAGMAHPTAEYVAYLDVVRRAGAVRQQARADDVLHLANGATLTALAPPQTLYPPNEGDTSASDDLILRLDTPGLSVLFLGAADSYALDALAGSGEPLAADVVALSLPRGAALDLSGPLGHALRAAHPHVIVICDSPAPALKGFSAVIA